MEKLEELNEEEMGSEHMGLIFGLKGFRALRVVCKCETEGFERRFRRQNVEERAIIPYIQRDEEYGAHSESVKGRLIPRNASLRNVCIRLSPIRSGPG